MSMGNRIDDDLLEPYLADAARIEFGSSRRLIRAVALSTTILATDWSDPDPLVVLRQSGGQIAEVLS